MASWIKYFIRWVSRPARAQSCSVLGSSPDRAIKTASIATPSGPPTSRQCSLNMSARDLTVVLSSIWRSDPVGLLAARHFDVPFDDVCPDMPDAPRCEEILSWLRKHPDVTRYVVLDDSDDCLDALPLFQPSAHTGL